MFFFHFGLTIEPARVLNVVPHVLVAVAMTMLLAGAAGVAAARIHGFGRIEAANIGYTVLTRGEFSLILASLAVAAGLDSRIGDLAAGYVLLLAVIGPILASATQHSSRLLPSRLFQRRSGAPASATLDLDVGAPSLYKLGPNSSRFASSPDRDYTECPWPSSGSPRLHLGNPCPRRHNQRSSSDHAATD